MSLILQVITTNQETFNLICGTKMRLSKICVALGLGFSGLIQGVEAQHKCGSDQYHQHLKQSDPQIAVAEDEINAILKENTLESRAAIYTIPVVFHVIHTNGPENISREQILDQLRVLNNDFNLLNGNRTKLRAAFNGLAADCQIKFELAKIWYRNHELQLHFSISHLVPNYAKN